MFIGYCFCVCVCVRCYMHVHCCLCTNVHSCRCVHCCVCAYSQFKKKKSWLKTSWELAWFYSVWCPRCDQGESTEVWPRGEYWGVTKGRGLECNMGHIKGATKGRRLWCGQGERTVGARRLWSGAVICGLWQQIALVPACLVLRHASLDQLLPPSLASFSRPTGC